MKLLIVEDNAEMRRLIVKIVSRLSHSIFECIDGCDAFEAYEQYLPDWVLMDVEMKTTDGITATRQITGVYPRARIVIVTNYKDDAVRRLAYAAGASGYVHKENLIELRQMLAH